MRLLDRLTFQSTISSSCFPPALIVAIFATSVSAIAQEAQSQQSQLTEPIYRVARESSTSSSPAPVPASQTAGRVFDLTQQPGEHPLAPVIRCWKDVLANIDQNVADYTCTFYKRERLDGQLGEAQQMDMKVRHQPFSVYLYFQQPYHGREVLYVDGQNQNNMIVLDVGMKRMLGKMTIDPNGYLAMQGQKHPITHIGIRNLMAEMIKNYQADMQFGECEVATDPNTKIGDRPTTMIKITHPVPRKNFRAYVARIFLDNELRVPIHYDAFLWPEQTGGQPPLEASYTYANLKINSGLTTRDFDPDNPALFQK
jgi:Protein of unknown function (DUF1571)